MVNIEVKKLIGGFITVRLSDEYSEGEVFLLKDSEVLHFIGKLQEALQATLGEGKEVGNDII